jgi:general secretion pathway protein G
MNDESIATSALASGHRRSESGMTLIEIMIVLALIALIAGSIGIAAVRHYKDGQVQAAGLLVHKISNSVEQFLITRHKCPSMDDLLAARFVKSEPRDPWGTLLAIRCPGEHDPDGADVLSYGPDRQEGTGDDIGSWKP